MIEPTRTVPATIAGASTEITTRNPLGGRGLAPLPHAGRSVARDYPLTLSRQPSVQVHPTLLAFLQGLTDSPHFGQDMAQSVSRERCRFPFHLSGCGRHGPPETS